MANEEFFAHVKHYFAYLLNEYGFHVSLERYNAEAFGSYVMELESQICRVRIVLDGREDIVSMALGPMFAFEKKDSTSGSQWADIQDLAQLINLATPSLFPGANSDWQLALLATTLRPYWEKLCLLFSVEHFPETLQQLKELSKRKRGVTQDVEHGTPGSSDEEIQRMRERLAPVLLRASTAWAQKDYAQVYALYESIQSFLTRSELEKFAYAKHVLNRF